MSSQEVDLVIIGAGSIGATLAYESSKRGMKTVLIDSGDIGGGTSCRSTKLLHGGVRYLELAFKTFDFDQLKLVQQALIERAHWLEQTPFLAKQIELALPSKNCLSKAYYRVGLGLYDYLSGNKSIGRSKLLSSAKLRESFPSISETIKGGTVYSDGQFDDARLNLLLALTAEKTGALIRTYCKVIEFERNSYGKLNGVICEDVNGRQERWKAKAIVNAAGIHADKVRKMADKDIEPRLLTSRGTHIVIGDNLCPNKMGLLIPSTDDGRVLFVLPFFGSTLVGTTDTPCKTEDAHRSSEAEQEYLIKHLKQWFPLIEKTKVKSIWAGGRPLLRSLNSVKESSRVVREHQVESMACGLISAMGGKWTTCRSIAYDTLEAIESVINKQLSPPTLEPILGANKNPTLTKSLLLKQTKHLLEHLPDSPSRNKQVAHLQSKYGLEALTFIKSYPKNELQPLSEVVPLCEAEIDQSIKQEHAKTANDILSRRCRLAMVNYSEAERILPIVQYHLEKANLPDCQLNLEE